MPEVLWTQFNNLSQETVCQNIVETIGKVFSVDVATLLICDRKCASKAAPSPWDNIREASRQSRDRINQNKQYFLTCKSSKALRDCSPRFFEEITFHAKTFISS